METNPQFIVFGLAAITVGIFGGTGILPYRGKRQIADYWGEETEKRLRKIEGSCIVALGVFLILRGTIWQ